MKKILKLSLLSAIAAGSLFAGEYNIDKSHSEVGFKVKHMMISNVKGNFTDFSGSFNYDEKSNQLTSLDGVVKINSINTNDSKRDAHLKADDMFDEAKYPEITFKTTKIEGNKVYGDFTMKGVTKNIVLDLENGGTIKDPWGNMRAGFSLTGKINREDFNLTWNKVLETGGIAVGKTVNLDLEVEGILKKN